jgi:hypothetical protein
MRWWIKALIFSVIFSVIWVGVVGVVGYITTDVFLAGKITQAQDHALSDKFGDLASSGIPLVWFICFLAFWVRWRRRAGTARDDRA